MATGGDLPGGNGSYLNLLAEAATKRRVEAELESTRREIRTVERKIRLERDISLLGAPDSDTEGRELPSRIVPAVNNDSGRQETVPKVLLENNNNVHEVVNQFVDSFHQIIAELKADQEALNKKCDTASKDRSNVEVTKPGYAGDTSMEQFVSTMDKFALKATLPALDIVKFNGDSSQYHKFKTRFDQMIGSQSLSEAHKMAHLMQFVEGRAKRAIVGFDGVTGGLVKALAVLERRFGQPHAVTEACISSLIHTPTISINDTQALCDFADKARTVYETLVTLQATGEMNSANLAIMARKLPIPLQVKWRNKAQLLRKRNSPPSLERPVMFIEEEADAASDPIFGKIGDSHKTKAKTDVVFSKRGSDNIKPGKTSTFTTQVEDDHASHKHNAKTKPKCYDCSENHKIADCPQFKRKTLKERDSFVRTNRLCFNCLAKHYLADCQVKRQCTICPGKHSTLLHKFKYNGDQAGAPASSNQPDVANSYAVGSSRPRVALQVVPIRVLGPGASVTTYALLDSGSEETFIRKSLSDRLKLRVGSQETMAISTMAGESSLIVNRVSLEVEAVRSPSKKVGIQGVVVPTLDISTARPNVSKWPHLEDIEMPEVDIEDVTMLIGANVPEVQVHLESRLGKAGEPFAVRTLLGWSVFGPISPAGSDSKQKVNAHFMKYGETRPESHLHQFLELDSLGVVEKKGMSAEDRRALKRLEDTTRKTDNRYEVGMLWKAENTWLPDNRALAESRLESLRRKLVKNPELHEKYTAFMTKLFSQGYAVQLSEEEKLKGNSKTWYLPHHSVTHPRKPEKVRVVFDAAAKFKGVSLNDQLLNGPDLTNSLLGILLRFREQPVAIVGDIEGFFLRVGVPDDDNEALRFLWWENGDLTGPVVECKMVRHIFGAKDSPCCCNYALKQTAEKSVGFSEQAVNAIKRSFYVDDHVDSVDTAETGIGQIQEVTELLRDNGGFRVTGWISNDREVLNTVPESERAKSLLNLDLDKLPVSRALGVEWDVEEDVLKFSVVKPSQPDTKRGVLSALSSLFDPIGLICPVILEAKNIMQRLWKIQKDWDDPLPADELRNWEDWKNGLSSLTGVKIPRCYLVCQQEVKDISLHNFSDASSIGYGMCAYLRFEYPNGDVSCSLVIGRSRCAPVKTTSIPRLELQAATLATRISSSIQEELRLKIARVTFWTDSMTVLQYIQNETKRFHVYVANRVAEIRDVTTPGQWRHCPGSLNPADDASRGVKPSAMADLKRWWQGPEFLLKSEEYWPESDVGPLPDTDVAVKREKTVLVTTELDVKECGLHKLILEAKSWSSLTTKAAFVMSMGKTGPVPEFVTAEEEEKASRWIIETIQAESFAQEIHQLRNGKEVKGETMKGLKPILVDNILRVGGRLEKAPTLSEDEKHPIILPKEHYVSKLVMRQAHGDLAHAGREQSLAETRKKFWVLGGRRLAKKIVRECIDCRRQNARPMEQVMAALPACRLTPYKPSFSFTGVDLFGPLEVKWDRGTAKRWGCLFTCLATRAVYLEVVQSLSTDDFILTLRQFISRRGPPEVIRCDNGSNFTGAERELREAIETWNQRTITDNMQQRGIKFIFQPPTAAHMSGVWERLVKTSKHHLKALSGDRLLTENGLRTLLAEAEAIMNGRPLCSVSDDPKDLEVLTPNHFLLHRKVSGLPPGIFVKEDHLLRREWRKVQYLLDLFWKRWLKEYLPGLQRREKWQTEKRNVRVGDLVMLAEDNIRRSQWPLGRITEVYPGTDDVVRSATVKTASAEYHRPIAKLCLLEAVEDKPDVCVR
ncbi:uncharacterized protein LOC135482999 [Lineus longissimus]|uniref:uncharacterized protein LOC135482999 n=1 Tax=Lineus longissimus TaxID=88925 RepID=UPI00315CD85C